MTVTTVKLQQSFAVFCFAIRIDLLSSLASFYTQKCSFYCAFCQSETYMFTVAQLCRFISFSHIWILLGSLRITIHLIEIVRFLPRYFSRHFVEIVRCTVVCMTENPFLQWIFIYCQWILQKLLIFNWHFPCHFFCNDIPIVWMPCACICALCPIYTTNPYAIALITCRNIYYLCDFLTRLTCCNSVAHFLSLIRIFVITVRMIIAN